MSTYPCTWRLLGLSALVSMACNCAHADEPAYYYGGISAGQSRASLDVTGLSGGLAPARVLSSSSRDDRDTGYKLFAGYQFDRLFGVEAGYFSLGRFAFSTTDTQGGTLNGTLRPRGLNLDLVARAPLSDALSVIARIGAIYSRTSDSFSGSAGTPPQGFSTVAHDTNGKLGLGLQYAFSSMMLRGELERYRISDGLNGRTNVNLLSMSLVFPFGRTVTAAHAAAMPRDTQPQALNTLPEPVAEPVQPVVPVVQLAPVEQPALLHSMSFSAESLFGFDRSEVMPQGRSALDRFAAETSGLNYEAITVEGHTDRLGTSAYNMSLSQRRADAVKRYLVDAGHLDATRISAVGLGETRPLTRTDACVGSRPTQQLQDCLQPDRRVDVTVTGAR